MSVFTINLEGTPPGGLYRSGDRVTGQVTLRCAKDEAVGSVGISFYGISKVKIKRSNGQSTSVYRSKALFFSHVIQLYQGHYKLREAEYNWPFEFTMPHVTDKIRQPDEFKPDFPYLIGEGMPLPPSWSCYHRGFGSSYEAAIEYRLEAKLERPANASIFATSKESRRCIAYAPNGPEFEPDPQINIRRRAFTRQSLLLLPENAGRELTLREKTRSLFHSQDLPSSTFSICVYVPQVIQVGRIVPLSIGIEYDLNKTTAPVTPLVTLKSLEVTVKTYVNVRSPSIFHNITDSSNEKQQSGPWQLDHPLDERTSFEQLGKPITFTRDNLPAFATPNISASQQVLQVKITVECAGKSFSAEINEGIRILARGVPVGMLPGGEVSRTREKNEYGPPAPAYGNDGEASGTQPYTPIFGNAPPGYDPSPAYALPEPGIEKATQ